MLDKNVTKPFSFMGTTNIRNFEEAILRRLNKRDVPIPTENGIKQFLLEKIKEHERLIKHSALNTKNNLDVKKLAIYNNLYNNSAEYLNARDAILKAKQVTDINYQYLIEYVHKKAMEDMENR